MDLREGRWTVTIAQEPDERQCAISFTATCPNFDEAVATALFHAGSRIGMLADIVSMYSRSALDDLPEELHGLSGAFFSAACELSVAINQRKESGDVSS